MRVGLCKHSIFLCCRRKSSNVHPVSHAQSLRYKRHWLCLVVWHVRSRVPPNQKADRIQDRDHEETSVVFCGERTSSLSARAADKLLLIWVRRVGWPDELGGVRAEVLKAAPQLPSLSGVPVIGAVQDRGHLAFELVARPTAA
jgi:hypothetical protein